MPIVLVLLMFAGAAGGVATAVGGGGGSSSTSTTSSPAAISYRTQYPLYTPSGNPAWNNSITSGEANIYRTSEYNAQYGLEKIHAAESYALLAKNQRSTAGEGVMVGVSDGGVKLTHQEILEPPSNEISSSFSNPNYNHGTHVASTIAGLKGNGGMHGVAFNSWIVSDYLGNDLTVLVNNGVKAINMSWGFTSGNAGLQLTIGSPTYEAYYSLMASSFNSAKAGDGGRGVFLAAATGNDGYVNNVGAPALFSQDVRLSGIMIAVAAVDSNNSIASFSNQCKQAKEFCLVAPGVNIYAATAGSNSEYSLLSGTSMATPHVAGAAAVIRGSWPHLTATQTAQILLTTATDLGAVGTDDVYGRGMLNLYAAVQAQGQNTLGYGASALSIQGYDVRNSSIVTSTIFGDAFAANVAPQLDSAIFLDDYGRDYKAFLGSKISTQMVSNIPTLDSLAFNNINSKVVPLFFGEKSSNELRFNFFNYQNHESGGENFNRTSSSKNSRNALFSASANDVSGVGNSSNVTGLKFLTVDGAKDPNLLMNNGFSFVRNSSDLSKDLKLGFAFNNDVIANSGQKKFSNFGFISQNNFAANPYQSFLTSSSVNQNSALGNSRKFNQFFADQSFLDKKFGLKFSYQSSYESSFSSGQLNSGLKKKKENEVFDFGIALNPRVGGNFLLSLGNMSEFNNNLLNSKSVGAFESSGDVKTSYIKFSSNQAVTKHLSLITSIAEGKSKINGNQYGIFREFKDVRSQSVSVAMVYDNFFNGRIGLAYSEPMRVYRGKVAVDIPVARDVDGNLFRYKTSASLVPKGKEQDLELFFLKSLSQDSEIKLNLIAQKDPGNVKSPNATYLGFVQLRRMFGSY